MAQAAHYIEGEQIEREFFKAMEPFERRLTAAAEAGRPIPYDARVDGLKVIDRTTDPGEMTTLLDFIDFEKTHGFEMRLYTGVSTHYDLHKFILKRSGPARREEITLEGLNNKIQEGIAEARRNWEHEQLVGEHSKLKKDHASLEEYADKIEAELEKLRAKKLHLGDVNLLEIGGIFLEGFIRRNPRMLARLPGGEALAGAIIQDNEERDTLQSQQPQNEPQTLIERSDGQLSENDKYHLELLRQLQSTFTQQDFMGAMAILDLLSQNPGLIPNVEKELRRKAGGRPEKDATIETTQIPDNV
jgi:hypothetical protein